MAPGQMAVADDGGRVLGGGRIAAGGAQPEAGPARSRTTAGGRMEASS